MKKQHANFYASAELNPTQDYINPKQFFMKKNLNASLSILSTRRCFILLLGIFGSFTLSAQTITPTAASYNIKSDGRPAKIERNFDSTFPNTEKVIWSKVDDDYSVLLVNGTVNCRMWYDKGGLVVTTHRYYKEAGLCPFILAKIKNKYVGKTVFGIIETHNDNGINYEIILEDDKKWYHVNADASGNLTMKEKFTKA
jgi:hypothetical protein